MLITLEGIDGSGKTTVWEALSDRYPEAVFTHEPTDTWYGDAVNRAIDDDDADPLAEEAQLTELDEETLELLEAFDTGADVGRDERGAVQHRERSADERLANLWSQVRRET